MNRDGFLRSVSNHTDRGDDSAALRRLVWLTVIGIGIVLRIVGLRAESLWLDEGFSLHLATTPHIWTELQKDSNPPGFFLLLRAWLAVAPLEAGTLRLLPSLLSIAALLVFADAARRLPMRHGGRTVALVLYATSPFLCWYAWELRSYSMLELGSVLMLNGIVRQTNERTLLGCIALGAGALTAGMAHYFGVLSCLGAAVVLWMLEARRARMAGLASIALGLGLCVPVYASLLPHQLDAPWGAQSHASVSYLATLPIRLFVVNSRLLPAAVVGAVAAVIGILGVASIVTAARDRSPSRSRLWWAAAVGVALPVATALLGTLVVEPRFTARYFIMVPAWLCILLGIGATACGRRGAAATAILAGGILTATTWLSTQLESKDGYREACGSLAASWRTNDLVGVVTAMPPGFNTGPLQAYLPAHITTSVSHAFEVGRPGPTAPWDRAHVIVRWMPYTEAAIRELIGRHRVVHRSGAVRNVEHLIVEPIR